MEILIVAGAIVLTLLGVSVMADTVKGWFAKR